jgi:flagellar protein FliS
MNPGEPAKPINAYLRTKVMTASPEELRLMLLEGAVKFARQGRDGIASRNWEQSFAGLNSAREIVVELMTTIRSEPNPELAQNVKALYAFIFSQLVEGGHEKDVRKLDVAIELLAYEVETWKLLMQRLAEERGGSVAPHGAEALPAEARAPLSVQG